MFTILFRFYFDFFTRCVEKFFYMIVGELHLTELIKLQTVEYSKVL